jgi:hypothetical protein
MDSSADACPLFISCTSGPLALDRSYCLALLVGDVFRYHSVKHETSKSIDGLRQRLTRSMALCDFAFMVHDGLTEFSLQYLFHVAKTLFSVLGTNLADNRESSEPETPAGRI